MVQAAVVGEWRVAVGVSLSEALTAFLADCQMRGLATKTLDFYRFQLGHALAWFTAHGVNDLDGLTVQHLREYVVSLAARGLSPASQHAGARSLRCWLRWCEAEDLLTGKNPVRRLKMPRRPRVMLPALGREELLAIIHAAQGTLTPERDTAIILTLADSGLRASELCGLVWGDVDLVSGRVFVRAGKGEKDRWVFLGHAARAALATYQATLAAAGGQEPVFQRANNRFPGGALHYDGLKMLLRRLGTAAGVPNCHAHAFRRSFAVAMLRDGADLVRLARILGHADLTMLQRHYLPLCVDDLADAHRQHSPADRLELAGSM